MEKAMRYEKYKELMKATGLWINPELYASWMPEKKKAHAEKAHGKRLTKKGKLKPAADTVSVVPSPLAAPPTVPPAPTPMYAQMASPPTMFTMMGRQYKLAVAMRTYKANATPLYKGSLIDGGCNGGLAGNDCIILDMHAFGKVDIVSVRDNFIENIPLCTAAGFIQTSAGPIIGIMHNYAALGKGRSIHSPLQMQDFGLLIDEKPKKPEAH
jgi:hypothetical protein